MPLTNFGSILNFAETLERRHLDFYAAAAHNPACAALTDQLALFSEDGRKHIRTIQRTRRENVTEMILEPIRDFQRAPYDTAVADPAGHDAAGVLAQARQLEETAEAYYRTAAEKIRALPEVARALKTLAKKRARRRQALERAEA